MLDSFVCFYDQGGPYMHPISCCAIAGWAITAALFARPGRSRLWLIAGVLPVLTVLFGLLGTAHGVMAAYEPVAGWLPDSARDLLSMMGHGLSVTMHTLVLALWVAVIQVVALTVVAVVRWEEVLVEIRFGRV